MPPYDEINENIGHILQFINPIHVTEYDWLVQNTHEVAEPEYQRRYKNYWRLNGAGLSQDFCQAYFQHLQAGLNNNIPQLNTLVNQLYQIPIRPNRHALQFSFCTKLCHMLNRNLPIYDSKIRKFYNFTTPSHNLPVQQRISRFIEFHQYLVAEYNRVLHNGLLTGSIQAFRQHFNPQQFTDIKVIDSLIWAFSPRENGNRMINIGENTMIVKSIAEAVHKAERENKKIAMFHYQILIHADELRGMDVIQFCKEIEVPESYATEYRKMLSLAALMKEQGATINKH